MKWQTAAGVKDCMSGTGGDEFVISAQALAVTIQAPFRTLFVSQIVRYNPINRLSTHIKANFMNKHL